MDPSAAQARTLTVLFTDLVGSTDAWSGLDRSAADRRRNRHFALMRAALTETGGREAKNLGDGLMTIFESVTAALAAAGAMQRAFEAARRGGEPMLGLRAGLCTGDVTAEGDDVFGVAVIAASRLCARAGAGQVLLPGGTRYLLGPASTHDFRDIGAFELKGIAGEMPVVELAWEAAGGEALRVVLADDASLVREGMARLLESVGIEVVAQAGDGVAAIAAVQAERPHAVVLDIRMPPTHRLEGLEAAEAILAQRTGVGVLLLSTHLDLEYARRLMVAGEGRGVGYLAKEKVSDIDEFAAAIRQVTAGGTAFAPELESVLTEHQG